MTTGDPAAKAAMAALALLLGSGAAPAADEGEHARLLEQKLRLLEMLVASSASKGTADADGAALLERRRQLLDQARRALAQGQTEDAGRAVDDGLKASRSGPRPPAGELATTALQASLANLGEQLGSYRAALQALAREGAAAAEAKALLARSDALAVEAAGHAAGGRLEDAQRRLAAAYRVVVEGLARLQAGQTVTLSLNFASAAEEYAYEQRRYESNELLVRMTAAEGRAAGEVAQRVDGFAGEARRLRDEAAVLAGRGDHRAAVTALEQASALLNRALQAMGVPVF